MQNNIYELDFSEIDIKNPFLITECTTSPLRKNSGSSLTDSLPYPPEMAYSVEDDHSERRKNNRGRKVDDFDYNSKIQEELEKIGPEPQDPSSKRKLIQKIRNRLSANRSRVRSKIMTDALKDENRALKQINNELKQKVDILSIENNKLLEKLFKNEIVHTGTKDDVDKSPIIRENPQIEKGYFKNLFFITAILLTITLLPMGSTDKVKLGGAVPLLSLSKPISKIRNATIREFCTRNNISEKSCISTKRYLYKLKQQINKVNNRITVDEKTPPQYKVKNFMNEVVFYTCYNADDKSKRNERSFLFDKEFLEAFSNKKEVHYVSEAWSVEDINN